ncbi:MAG TPA: nucleotidyltransferase family protein [Bacteroidales bacterium]|nr:nucleotidyltransferase family protein [Bacteroidales bacterium]
MEAIVLAGGFGTRIRHVIGDIPKPMAPVNGRPFLEYLLDELIDGGVTRAILSVGFRSEAIIGHFGERYRDLPLDYAVETEPLGTGGGIRLALWKASELRALVINGDSLFRIDFRAMMDLHLKKKADATLALRKMSDTGRYGRVMMNRNRRITGFEEKRADAGPGYINGGVYIVEKYFLMEPDFRGKFSMEKDCFERLYPEAAFFGFPSEGYFVDIGIPEDYQKAQDDFRSFKG